MLDYNKQYTLQELIEHCESNNLEYHYFDDDDYNFDFKCFTWNGFTWYFSGMTGNSLYLRYTKFDNYEMETERTGDY